MYLVFFFKQKPAYEMRISDWSSDVCSSDLLCADDYVIQLDSDTVTIGPVPHIQQAIAANSSFTLLGAETDIDSILSVDEFTRNFFPDGQPSQEDFEGHIQGEIGRASCRERVCQYV